MIFALVGNQNCGKTTLFNALTGSNQHVGNFPGVTVDQKMGEVRGQKNCSVVDLPGIYSLSPYTLEEVVARNYLIDQRPDAILNIIDGTNLERNLYLTTQLTELGIPVVVAINMMDVVRKNGDKIDTAQLSEKLEKAGPVPFASAEIEKRLAPEEILADTKSIAVILFPYRYPEEKNANIALYARAKDYHHVVRAYLAKIIGYMEEQYPNEKFHAITDTSPMADRWLAYQAGLGFFGRNHCLIHPKYGSYFTIGAILTTLALPPDIPLAMNLSLIHI